MEKTALHKLSLLRLRASRVVGLNGNARGEQRQPLSSSIDKSVIRSSEAKVKIVPCPDFFFSFFFKLKGVFEVKNSSSLLYRMCYSGTCCTITKQLVTDLVHANIVLSVKVTNYNASSVTVLWTCLDRIHSSGMNKEMHTAFHYFYSLLLKCLQSSSRWI